MKFKNRGELEDYIGEYCKDNFGFDCIPFTIADQFLYIKCPHKYTKQVKDLVFRCAPELNECKVETSKHYKNTDTLRFNR